MNTFSRRADLTALNALHVSIREAKVMSNLVDKDMVDGIRECCTAFLCISDDRIAIDYHFVRKAGQIEGAFLREIDAMIKPQEFEGVSNLERR